MRRGVVTPTNRSTARRRSTRRSWTAGAAVATVSLIGPLAATAGAGQPAPPGPPTEPEQRTVAALGLQTAPSARPGEKPRSANPYLSLLPDPTKADYVGWRRVLRAGGKARADRLAAAARSAQTQPPLQVEDAEPATGRGRNDTLGTAQRAAGFGTDRRANPRAHITGTLAPEQVAPVTLPAGSEDDGAIPSARTTGISPRRQAVSVRGRIGDGPHGSAGDATGDFDFYRVDATAGSTLTAVVDPAGGTLSPAIVLFDARGRPVTAGQDMTGEGGPVRLSYPVRADGTYYVEVGSTTPWPYPMDPFDSGSGVGVGTEGPYAATLTVADVDTDIYAVDLAPGDVIGATVRGSGHQVSILDPDGVVVQRSGVDVTALYPASSPLPGGGNATADHVASRAGRYYVSVADGDGAYDAAVEAYRSGGAHPPTQTILLDFDGARIDNRIFGGAATEPGVRDLSGLSDFLGRWGLTKADEPALVGAVARTVRDNLYDEVAAGSANSRIDLRVVTSATAPADLFGRRGVSRVIVGGTLEEAGLMPLLGISQAVDPGNLSREDTALVLLDQLSNPAGDPLSLNTYLSPRSDKIAFLGQAIGNVVSHEAGHFLGSYHTSNISGVTNLMDTGYVYELYGLGPDLIGGTADDLDNHFGTDVYEETQGFFGQENTLERTGFGLTRGTGVRPPRH